MLDFFVNLCCSHTGEQLTRFFLGGVDEREVSVILQMSEGKTPSRTGVPIKKFIIYLAEFSKMAIAITLKAHRYTLVHPCRYITVNARAPYRELQIALPRHACPH